jgi:hypothetical protein
LWQELNSDGIAAIFDLTDENGSGSLSKEEFVSVVRAMRINQKDSHGREKESKEKAAQAKRKTKKVMKISAVGIGILITTIALQTIAMFLVVDSQVKTTDTDGVLTSKTTGTAMQTSVAVSYTTLFDLPAFDTETLAHLKQATLLNAYVYDPPREGWTIS